MGNKKYILTNTGQVLESEEYFRMLNANPREIGFPVVHSSNRQLLEKNSQAIIDKFNRRNYGRGRMDKDS
jgi:hypothetical protein